MTKQHDLSKLYLDLDELSGRWALSVSVLLAHASAGQLVVVLPHFGKELEPVIGGEYEAGAETSANDVDPIWAVRVDSNVLSVLAASGEASLEVGYRYGINGKEAVTFDPPRRITTTDLVVAIEEVLRHESGGHAAEISMTTKAALQKQMALLAMLVAQKCSGYDWGEGFSAKKIADDTEAMLTAIKKDFPESDVAKALDNLGVSGISPDYIRQNIGAGIKLLKGEL